MDRLQRFFDGPIPAPDRRWIFADPGHAARSASAEWHAQANDSSGRAERLRWRAQHAATPHERRSAALALPAELDWHRHCRERSDAARAAERPPG